ncbi:MAG: hypothetical protein ABFR89_04925 [Actinomycetota bacterium]
MSESMIELVLFIVMAVVVIAVLSYAAWYFLDTRRHVKWREHEDEMMEEITEQRIRRNFMQGG